MAILMPVLQRAKGAAMTALCLSNTHNLSLAWFAYTIDNDGRLVGPETRCSDNSDPGHAGGGQHWFWYCWVTAPQNAAGTYVDYQTATYEDKIRAIERGLLFPYVKNVKVYHCPADTRYKKPAADPAYQGTCGGYHSYSIAACMNGTLWIDDMIRQYHSCTIYTQIKAPAGKYVFVEDNDPRGFNVNAWEIDLTTHRWSADYPAVWHYNKSNLGFADGHAETHRWMDKKTIKIGQAKTVDEINALRGEEQPQNQDLIYLQQHYAALRGAETN